MSLLYQVGIRIYALLVWVASLTNDKARKWINGRKQLFDNLSEKFKHNSDPVYWFHCASLGEFEQARPVMEALKSKRPEIKLLVTFYSPSGFEVRKEYQHAYHVCYLPLDTKSNAKRFVDIVQPDKAIFVKYEFWFNFLDVLNNRAIDTVLISGVFHPGQVFFKWTGKWAIPKLKAFQHFFLQDERSAGMLQSLNYNNYTVAGDTRFDRVHDSAKSANRLPVIEKFLGDNKAFIAGSTWSDDENILLPFINERTDIKTIIAPHEIHESHLKDIELKLKVSSIRYSKLEKESGDAQVLIIDNIGMLSRMYQYGKLAYIGGAFHGALHNILEAAAFGLPVVFGPDHYKFFEAQALIDLGGAFCIDRTSDLEKVYSELDYKEISSINTNFVSSHTGASEKILQHLL